MTIHLRRQVAIRTVQGIVDTLPDGTVFPYRLTDVQPNHVLNIGNGLYTSNSIELNASDSYSIPVPSGYSSANKLACILRADSICKVVIVDPSLGTSTFLLKGTQGTTKGDHKGLLMWQGRVTSITVSVPATYDDTIIDYFLWSIPDLTDEASWMYGNQITGVVQ